MKARWGTKAEAPSSDVHWFARVPWTTAVGGGWRSLCGQVVARKLTSGKVLRSNGLAVKELHRRIGERGDGCGRCARAVRRERRA